MANISYGVNIIPKTNNAYTLGNSSYKWSNIYSVQLNGTNISDLATKSETHAAIAIVEDGDTATNNITQGQYVMWKGALYQASSAISSGTTLSSSNLTAKTNGLGGEIQSLSNDIISINYRFGTVTGNYTADNITYPGIFYVDNGTDSGILISALNGSLVRQIFISDDGTTHTVRSYDGTSWGTAHSF